ncbi:MAG TPA: YihY/virulence factor BrkB family protein [Sphingomicrobium sp.]|nr:YihY/virulence factor BrkB family protein [Sphingomicrobium sp.]
MPAKQPEVVLVEREKPRQRSIGDIARNVWHEAVTDRAMLSAGGLAFFALFGLLPAIAAVGAIYGLLIPASTLEAQIGSLEETFPEPVITMLREFVSEVPRGFGLGVGLAANLAIVLWTVQRSASGFITALNLVHDLEEERGLIKREVAALWIAGASLALIAVSLLLIVVLPLGAPAFGSPFDRLVMIGRWPLAAALFLLYLWGVYRIAPAEPPRKAKWISIGALVALGLWLAASGLFSLYVSVIGGFSPYYGSATAPVVLLAWLFITAWVVLIGAEVNEQLVEMHDGKPRDDLKDKVDHA